MERLSSGQRVGVLTILAIVAVVTGVSALRAWQASSPPGIALRQSASPSTASPPILPPSAVTTDRRVTDTHSTTTPTLSDTSDSDELVIHVVGAVRRPGVYHLHRGARCEDAVHAAGGPTAWANTDAINLAARLEDGTQLYVPTRKEHPEDHAIVAGSAAMPATSALAAAFTSATTGKRDGKQSASNPRGGSRSAKLTSPEQGQVDLNRASAAELQRIPGIGPSMAERLIAYRQQNGGFHSVEDLLQVRGIGEKKYEKMKSFIKTGFETEAIGKKQAGR
jgi:competence protein ComEA